MTSDNKNDTPSPSEQDKGQPAKPVPPLSAGPRPGEPAKEPPKGDPSKSDPGKGESGKGESGKAGAASQPAAKPPRRGLGVIGAFIVGLFSAAAVAAALLVTLPQWLPLLKLQGQAPQQGVSPAELDTKLAALGKRIDTVQSAAAPQTDLGDRLHKLQDELAALTKQYNDLADTVAQLTARQGGGSATAPAGPDAATTARIAALEKRMDDIAATAERVRNVRGDIDALIGELGKSGDRAAKLEQRVAALEKTVADRQESDRHALEAARAATVVALAARLRSAIETGRPFAPELAALKNVVGDDAALGEPVATLQPMADKGVTSLARLKQDFEGVARAVVAADAQDHAQEWWEKALARLRNVVSIRRTGSDVTGEDAEARVARAETDLAQDRLDAAVAELKPLAGQAAKAAAPWLAGADAQLAAQAAADKLLSLGAARLAQSEPAR